MKKETQLELFKKFTERQLEIISSKQNDYADIDKCVLENFKTAGANVGISTEQQILSLIATKVARLGNLFKGKVPNNESIEDSIIDMANYCFLLHCAIEDKRAGKRISDLPKASFPTDSSQQQLFVITSKGKTWLEHQEEEYIKSLNQGIEEMYNHRYNLRNKLTEYVKERVQLPDNQEEKLTKIIAINHLL